MFFTLESCRKAFLQIFGGDFFNDIADMLLLNPSASNNIFSSAWEIAVEANQKIVVPIATALLLIYFIVYFFQKASSEQCTFEQLFLLFCKMIAAKFLIEHGVELFMYILDFGVWFSNAVNLEITSSTLSETQIQNLWKDVTGYDWSATEFTGIDNIIGAFGFWMQILIPWVATMLLKYYIKVLCYVRFIELLVRTATAPIALSDFFKEGLHGAGYRFLMNYLAVALQGGVMLITAILYSKVIGGFMENYKGDIIFVDFTFMYLAITFAFVSVMSKSSQLTKEFVGQ